MVGLHRTGNRVKPRLLCLFLSVVACCFGSSTLYAAAIVVDTIKDQRSHPGESYVYQPESPSQSRLLWRKSYGPDELEVDPFSGLVSWKIPEDYFQQSLHVGVIASDGVSETEEVWVLTVGQGAITYLEAGVRMDRALRKMKSGDTLIIQSGTIDSSRAMNRIDAKKSAQPPAGRPGIFTTVIAAEPGGTVMDAHDADVFGLHLIETKYIKIAGIVVKHSGRIGVRLVKTDHVYLKDIGIADSGRSRNSYNHNVANLNVIFSKNFLIEGLYSWGHSRYKAQFTRSEKGIVRRSIARIDHYYGSNPIGGFQSYCSKDIVYQNNILIDSDTSNFWPRFKNHQNAFGVPATNCMGLPVGNVFDRNLVLNSHIGAMQTDASDAESPTIWRDTVGWDILLDGYGAGKGPPTALLRSVGPSETSNATLGKVRFRPSKKYPGARYLYGRNAESTVSRSIIADIPMPGDLVWANDPKLTISDSIVFRFAGSMTGGENAYAERIDNDDPEMRYLPRAPESLSTHCAGARCGADISNYIGKAGTFWGEPGADVDAGVAAWPVVGEQGIAQQMRSYRHEGPVRGGETGRLSGNRGFASEHTNLTDYVWGYLGELVPPLRVYARSTSAGTEIMWLPADDESVTSYNIYRHEGREPKKIGSIAAVDAVLSFSPGSADTKPPFTVTAVSSDGTESGHGYRVSPR